MKRALRLAGVTAGCSILAASAAPLVVFDLGTTINGSTPTGTPPFLRATFETVAPGTVVLTMTNTMPATNFVDNWVFNLVEPVSLGFSHVTGVAALAQSSGHDFTNGGSNMKAGLFDVEFHYPGNTSDPDKFDGGHSSVYQITGVGLTEASFVALSVDDPGSPPSPGGWYSAAHVQGFGSGLSGSIGTNQVVPEPAALATLAFGIGALSVRRRRR